MNNNSEKPDLEELEGPRGEPLDLDKARISIEAAEGILKSIPWPPFFALEESAANSLVRVALHNLERARSRLDLEEARRTQALKVGDLDERPLLSVLDPHPTPPDDWDPLGLKENWRLVAKASRDSKRPWWRRDLPIRPMFAFSVVLGFILSCLLIILWEGGVVSW